VLSHLCLVHPGHQITHLHTIQVMENSNINADPRNQAVSAAADGVPFFKDRNAANGWPFVMYPENAPVGVSRNNEHAHMVGLVPGEYLTEDEDGKKLLVKKYVHHHAHLIQHELMFHTARDVCG
jgi:hypothetical protein